MFWIWISCDENSAIEKEGKPRTYYVKEDEPWKYNKSQEDW